MKRKAKKLSHVRRGRPAMVNVGGKKITRRVARAQAVVLLPPEVRKALRGGDLQSAKGPVFQTAVIAGIAAAKRTAELIPLCHPIPMEDCAIDIRPRGRDRLTIECRVEARYRTGVEMEALTGAAVAALAVYDMCKALSRGIVIEDLRLLEKKGGRHDYAAP